MDVGAVADAVRLDDRGKDRAMPEPMGDGARHLAGDHRFVGGAQAARGGGRDLVLPAAIFGQEAVGGEARGAQRRHVGFAEDPLAAVGVERIGRAGPVLDAGIDKLLLERRQERKTCGLVERGEGAAQEIARAAFPERTLGGQDVAEVEALPARLEKPTPTAVLGSGTSIRSPSVPNGVS